MGERKCNVSRCYGCNQIYIN